MKRIVFVSGRGMVTLHSTEDPTIWFAESSGDPNVKYRIGGVGGAATFCTCPATVVCKHMLAVFMLQEEMMSELPTAVGQSTAVIPRQSVTSLDARRAQNSSSQAISLAARGAVDGYREYLFLAQSMWEGKMVPDSVKSPQAAAVLMLRAAELGVPPMAAFELFYVVGNKVAIQGQMISALIERSGKGYTVINESTAERAVVTGYRDGRPPLRVEWTIQDAQAAGSKPMGGWKDKLVWKATARIGRQMFADVLGGMDVADGSGVVVDYAVVPEVEGEYQRPELSAPQEPAPKPRYAWTDEFKVALDESPFSMGDVLAFLKTDREGAGAAIDALIAFGDTPATIMTAIGRWADNGRKHVPPIEHHPDAATEPTEAVTQPEMVA